MKIIHWGKARQFYKKHPLAENPLRQWRKIAQENEWTNFHDIRSSFPSADWVNGNIIFNIKGNSYRLIAITAFENSKLYIRQVLTHEDYDKNKWKT